MINTHRRLATLLVGGLALLTLAACGGSGSSTDGQAQGQPSGASGQAGGQGGQNGVPGVSGLIVSLSGKTMQVRTTSGQSAVTYTSKTTVTEQQSAKAADAKVGVCATVRSADGSASAGSSSTAITAGSVSLSDEVDGSCQRGFGGGSRPSGMPSGGSDRQGAPPSGAASGGPAGAPSRAMPSGAQRGGFGGASGKITKVDGSTLTIEQTRGTDKTSVTVTLTGDTTFTKQAKTDTDAIAKGKCVFASGKSDSTGALSATALRLSAATNGACQLGGQGRRNPSGGQSSGG